MFVKRPWLAPALILVVLAAAYGILRLRQPALSTPNLVVATVAPLTGPAAELGRYNVNAAELAMEDAKSGKVSLQLIVEDSKSTAKDGVQAVQAILAKAKPKVFMVHQGPVSVATAPTVASSGAVLFYIGATDAPKAVHPLAFRIYPDPTHVARQTIEQLIVPYGLKSLALFCANDEFGVVVGKAIREKVKTSQISLVFDEDYNPSTTDFRTTLGKLEVAGAEVLYVVGVGAPLGRIISQARQAGFRGQIISGPELQFGDVLSAAGPAAEGARFLDLTFDVESDNEPTKSFVARYQAAYGAKPTAASALVYDGWSIAIRAVNAASTMSPSDIAEAVIALRQHDGVSGHITITPERDFVYTLVARSIQDGKAILLPSSTEQPVSR